MLESEIILRDRYQLKRQLGKNQGRETWLSEDLTSHSLVVVKLLAFSPQMQWDDLKLFEREAQVLQQLNHPKIPCYRDNFFLDRIEGTALSWFALVQDYLPGKSLQQLLNEGRRFSENEVKDMAAQVLEVLIDLHAQDPPVLHRDIKPSNLILGENNQVYLVDFGAVKNTAAVTGVTFTIVGTVGYAPLEQFWGKAVPSSDLYALGATMIHCLTGIAPADLPQEKLRIKFADRLSINPRLVLWVEGMTAPDPDQRYQTAAQALADLKAEGYLMSNQESISSPFSDRVQIQRSHHSLNIEILGKRKLIVIDFLIIPGKLVPKLCLSFLVLIATFTYPFILSGLPLAGLFFWISDLLGDSVFPLPISEILITSIIIGIFVFPVLSGILWLCGIRWIHSWSTAWKKDLDIFCQTLQQDWLNPRLFNYGSEDRISFDPELFSIRGTIFGLTHSNQTETTGNIQEIVLSKQAICIFSKHGETYRFGYGLNPEEQQWLISLIQDWLMSKSHK